jgi:hypothetical protein
MNTGPLFLVLACLAVGYPEVTMKIVLGYTAWVLREDRASASQG